MVNLLEITVAVSVAVSTAAPATPPNVVFIVGDDVGYNDFGHFNGGKVQTPTIDGVCMRALSAHDLFTACHQNPPKALAEVGFISLCKQQKRLRILHSRPRTAHAADYQITLATSTTAPRVAAQTVCDIHSHHRSCSC